MATAYFAPGERILTDERKASLRGQYVAGVPEALEIVRLARMPVESIYDDTGIHSLLAGHMTGEESFFADAVARFVPRGVYHQTKGDNTRQYQTLFAQMFTWLRGWMTPEQREAVMDGLNWNAGFMLGINGSGTRLSDSDEAVCHGLGLVNTAKAIEADRPEQAAYILNHPSGIVPKTMDFIRRYCSVLSKGGELPESTSYNPNTGQLMVQGTVGVGIELFPEVSALITEAADFFPWHFTPEATGWDVLRWGTIYNQNDIEMKSLWGWTAILAGITGSPAVLGMFAKYRTRYPSLAALYSDARFSMWRGFLFLDHALIPATPPPDTAFGVRVCEGVGMAIYRSPTSMVVVQSCPPLWIDHPDYALSDVMVRVDGEWAANRPMRDDDHPFLENTAVLAGANMPPRDRGLVSAESLPGGGMRVVERARGTLVDMSKFEPPTPFVVEWRRETLWEPAGKKLTVTDDFAYLFDPTLDPRFTHYAALDASLPANMRARLGMAMSQIHSYPNPAPIHDGWQYSTPKGSNVVVQCSGHSRRDEQPALSPFENKFRRLRFAADGMTSKLVTTLRFGAPLEPTEALPVYSAPPIPDPASPPFPSPTVPPPPPSPPSPPVVPPSPLPALTPEGRIADLEALVRHFVTLPANVVYLDYFDTLRPTWKPAGHTAQKWSVPAGSGIVQQTDATKADPKKLILFRAVPAAVQISADWRVDSWVPGDPARVGVGLYTDPATGRGYNLVARDNGTVRFLDDNVRWGNSFPFVWKPGIWYRFVLRIEAGVLKGKVWWVASDPEPADWMFTQTGWTNRTGGAVCLNGSSGGATASFANVVIQDVTSTV